MRNRTFIVPNRITHPPILGNPIKRSKSRHVENLKKCPKSVRRNPPVSLMSTPPKFHRVSAVRDRAWRIKMRTRAFWSAGGRGGAYGCLQQKGVRAFWRGYNVAHILLSEFHAQIVSPCYGLPCGCLALRLNKTEPQAPRNQNTRKPDAGSQCESTAWTDTPQQNLPRSRLATLSGDPVCRSRLRAVRGRTALLVGVTSKSRSLHTRSARKQMAAPRSPACRSLARHRHPSLELHPVPCLLRSKPHPGCHRRTQLGRSHSFWNL